jgi:hypothetical protein
LAERTTADRRIRLLVGAWIFAAVALVFFAWLTTGSYVRQMLRPLPGEADRTLRDCKAVPSCAPGATDMVNRQVDFLQHTRTLTYASAWSVAILATAVVAMATVFLLRRPNDRTVRLLGMAWAIQAAWTGLLLLTQATVLEVGSHRLADTPEAARMFTSIKAYDAPFTDAGNLYYLAWFIAVGCAAAALTRTLSQR